VSSRVWGRGRPLSYSDHARILATSGFTLVRGFGRLPATRPYQVYIPLDDPSAVDYWMGKRPPPQGTRQRIRDAAKTAFGRIGAWQYAFNNFLVTARRFE